MNRRVKFLAAILGVCVAALVIVLAVKRFVLAPSRAMEKQRNDLERKIASLELDAQKIRFNDDRLGRLAKRTLGSDVDQVNRLVSLRLAKLLESCGLTRNMRVLMVNPGPVGKGADEVRCNVSAEGSLTNISDLLYLLKAEPQLHRLDNLTIKPVGKARNVLITFRYATLVLSRRPGQATPATLPADALAEASLNDAGRRAYDVLAERNLLRKYVPPIAAAPPRWQHRPPTTAETQPPQPQPFVSQHQVVALPSWAGRPEVFVRNTSTGEVHRYKRGDSLADGKIVLVDYRLLPRPDRPELLSQSRVIVKIGREYWAVELGQRLSEKRRLRSAQLPAELQDKD